MHVLGYRIYFILFRLKKDLFYYEDILGNNMIYRIKY